MSNFSGLVTACESAWESIQKEYSDVPDAVVLVGSGGRRASTLYGHFAPNMWVRGDDAESHLHEVLIVAEQLHRGGRDIFTTLLHEAVHGIAQTREIKDVSGYRHNKRFRNLCEEVGMEPPETPNKRIGWSAATLSDSLAWQFREEIEAIDKELTLCRVLTTGKEKIKSSWAAVCGCNRKIRVGKKIYPGDDEPIDIACKQCGTDFVVEDEDA